MAPNETDLDNGLVAGMGALLNGEVRQRVDIDVMLFNQPDTFNLLLLALVDLQKEAGSNKLGYFSLAGIHGLPTALWDGVGKTFADRWGGYCAHGVLIFPTWHRPYLALIEQALYRKMLSKVKEFHESLQPKYHQAADAFRLPYFDYFRPRDRNARFPGITLEGLETAFAFDFRMPDIMNVKNVMVRVPPNDSLESRENPLYTFKFDDQHMIPTEELDAADLEAYSTSQTVRHPEDNTSVTHNVQEMSDVLNSGREGRTSMMLDILNSTNYGRFGQIATDMVLREGEMTRTALSQKTIDLLGGPQAFGSLEGIHGNYHNFIGGPGGHMQHPSISAFDPVFWFHHCQIDRLFAIWQALHPTAWFPSPPGVKPESTKSLLPFYKSRNGSDWDFFNSDDSRDTKPLGYTYPDLDGPATVQDIWQKLEERYIWSIRTAMSPNFGTPPEDMAELSLNTAQVFQFESSILPAAISSLHAAGQKVFEQAKSVIASSTAPADKKDNTQAPESTADTSGATIDPNFDREWYIDNIVKRNALNGPFTVYFFLCPKDTFPDDPANYVANPYLAGVNHIFVAPREVCDNCGNQDAAGELAADTVPITPLLLDYVLNGTLESMRLDHVRPFLKKYLRWRVIHGPAVKKNPRELEFFQLAVSAKISNADGSKTYESYPDIIEAIVGNAA